MLGQNMGLCQLLKSLFSPLPHPFKEMMFVSIGRQLDAVVQLQLPEYIADMVPHCLLAQVQQPADFGVGSTPRQVADYLY
jgi:hypothetical protein